MEQREAERRERPEEELVGKEVRMRAARESRMIRCRGGGGGGEVGLAFPLPLTSTGGGATGGWFWFGGGGAGGGGLRRAMRAGIR